MKSFNEWLNENNLLIEFDPNRGAVGRAIPKYLDPKNAPPTERYSLDNPQTRKLRLQQIYKAFAQNGEHYGAKFVSDTELNDPEVKRIIKNLRKTGGNGNDLTYTSSVYDKYDPDFMKQKESPAQAQDRDMQNQKMNRKNWYSGNNPWNKKK